MELTQEEALYERALEFWATSKTKIEGKLQLLQVYVSKSKNKKKTYKSGWKSAVLSDRSSPVVSLTVLKNTLNSKVA